MQTSPSRNYRTTALFLFVTVIAAVTISGCASRNVGYKAGHGKTGGGKRSEPTLAPYTINNITYYPIADATGFREKGLASWYGDYFHGRPTSNGERYDMYGMTAAHKILPMNTMLRVCNLENGKEIMVRVNDRGPFVEGRIIDLSYTAASHLGILQPGTSRVEIVALSQKPTPLVRSSTSQPDRRPEKLPKEPHMELPRKEYYVQVGKFDQMEGAVKLRKRFSDAGHPAVIQTVEGAYQVFVFAGKELAMAKETEAALLARGYTGATLITR